MKTEHGGLRHFAIAFGLAVLLYFGAFQLIESCRVAKRPWQVTFLQKPSGPPALVIDKRNSPVALMRIVFEDVPITTNALEQKVEFSTAREVPFAVPFGKCVFLDTTFLPGTVTLQCFGHEIEMIPRVLIIDHREHAWTNGVVFVR